MTNDETSSKFEPPRNLKLSIFVPVSGFDIRASGFSIMAGSLFYLGA
jgi:hypothetical protein